MVEFSLCLTDLIHIPCFLYSTSMFTKSELFIIGGRHVKRHELASTFLALEKSLIQGLINRPSSPDNLVLTEVFQQLWGQS